MTKTIEEAIQEAIEEGVDPKYIAKKANEFAQNRVYEAKITKAVSKAIFELQSGDREEIGLREQLNFFNAFLWNRKVLHSTGWIGLVECIKDIAVANHITLSKTTNWG